MTRSLAVSLFYGGFVGIVAVLEVVLLVNIIQRRFAFRPFGEPPEPALLREVRGVQAQEDAVAALDRADALLKKTIGETQWRNLQKNHVVEVVVKDIPLVSLVRIDGLGRCWAVGKQIGAEYMCVLPNSSEALPYSDIILTMYLMAKYNPKKLLQTANWSHRHLV